MLNPTESTAGTGSRMFVVHASWQRDLERGSGRLALWAEDSSVELPAGGRVGRPRFRSTRSPRPMTTSPSWV